ncbi:hypothetical protein [Ureibacillus sp. FSL K6-3587]|jgi:hypothetical protein|uniref:hypothetical protein n=1 Tax=Ureibacillus sp. FSL K6-3587 TaxID=2954681 RepID=UPI003158FFDB
MTQLILTTLIFSIITTVLIVPVTRKLPKGDVLPFKQLLQTFVFVFITSWILYFLIVYLTKIDVQWTVALYAMPVILLFGVLASGGAERALKGLLFFASLIGLIYLLIVPIFNADEKYESAKMEQEVEIEPFDETKTPASVPPQFAENKMKKAFGQVPNTSYYELGNLQIQKVNGEFVYIAPVEFSGFFKWLNGDTTPGYFKMSATDSNDNPVFVAKEMVYVPSAFFNKNLERHIRLQYPTLIFYGDPQLEVDDDGTPYYIRSYGEFISARNGFDVKGIVMVDAYSGETKKIPLEEVPEFIDGAVSPEAVSLQNSYFGKYVHGFWNSIFGKKDVKLPSDEGTEANVSPVFNQDGEMYYFTDFTSPKEGVDSMLGYSLTHARTGKAVYYTGNIEESYMDSQGALDIIEKKFIEKEWHGAMPILYNFYGEASWLAPVLDTNGFLQNYFIVSAVNPEISVYGSTPNEALRQYKTALTRGASSVDGSSNAEEKTITGTVLRVYKEQVGDYTLVSFLLNNGQNFVVSSQNEPLSIYLREGDQVVIRYFETGETFLPVKALQIEGVVNIGQS